MSTESNDEILNQPELNVPNQEEIANYYLKKHRITELFENLTAALVYERPENPKAFMIEFVDRLHASKIANKMDNPPCIFDKSNIISLFGIMDPVNKGYINHSQYISGMENLGITSFEHNPPGSDHDKICLDTFVSEVQNGLSVATATYAS